MDCSTPDFLILHHLTQLGKTHVYWVGDAIQPSHRLSSPFPPAFNLSQHQGFFPINWLFTSGGHRTGASASASVLPKHWFPLRFTGLVSLKSKRLPGIFSSTIIQKHRFFSTQPSLWPNFHILIWLLEETIAFGVGEDSWESLGLQGDPTSPS